MNDMNLRIVQALVEYDRERIRHHMERIRWEEEAIQAGRTEEKTAKERLYLPRLLMRIATLLVQSTFGVGK